MSEEGNFFESFFTNLPRRSGKMPNPDELYYSVKIYEAVKKFEKDEISAEELVDILKNLKSRKQKIPDE